MVTESGRSASRRAGRPTDQAAARLGDTATIPNAEREFKDGFALGFAHCERTGGDWLEAVRGAQLEWAARAKAAELKATSGPGQALILIAPLGAALLCLFLMLADASGNWPGVMSYAALVFGVFGTILAASGTGGSAQDGAARLDPKGAGPTVEGGDAQ